MKRKVLKISGGVVLLVVILLVGAFSYVSSGHFIQSQVLPRVSEALGVEVEAEDASFAALSQLELKNLRVGSEADPLLRAGTIRVQYRALALLSRKVEISEVLLDGVAISITPEKLAALQSAAPAEAKPAKPKAPAEPKALPEIVVQHVRIKDLSLDYAAQGAAGPMKVQIPQFNLELPELAGGRDLHLTIATQARVVSGDMLDAELQTITLDLQGALDQALMPRNLDLLVKLDDLEGSAGPVGLAGRRIQLAVKLEGSSEHYEVKQLELAEYNGDVPDATLGATGTLALKPAAAALDLSANIPAGSLLDLVGALAGGLDFGQTAIAYTGHVDMPSSGSVASRGELSIRDLSVATTNLPALRPLQVAANHDVALDLEKHRLTLNRLDLTIDDGGRQVVGVKLEKPLQLDLQQPGGDASTRIAVTVDRLDLTMFNALLASQPDVRILGGEVNRAVNIDVEQGGRLVKVDVGGGGIDHLIVQQGDRRIGPLRINHEARLRLADFKTLAIDHFKVELIPLMAGTAPAATLQVGGAVQLVPEPTGQLNVAVDGQCDRLLSLARPFIPPDAGVRRLAGAINVSSTVQLAGKEQPIQLEASSKLEGIDFALDDGTRLARLVSSGFDLKLNYVAGGVARVDRCDLLLKQTGQSEPMLDLGAKVVFDTSLNPDVKNTVEIAARGPVQLDALEGLLVKPLPTEQSANTPAPEASEAAPPNLWVETILTAEQATYRQMEISNLVVNATYRNGKLDLAKAYSVVNGGEINASGTCDLTNPAQPGYDLTLAGSQLPFAPMLSSFAPSAPLVLSGGLKTANLQLNGSGFDLPSLQKNLKANVDLQLDQLVVEQLGGTLGRLTQTLLLAIFSMDMQDMAFADGGLKLAIDSGRYGDSNIHIEQLLMRAPIFMLDGSGTVQLGGTWEPDIELKTGFSDGKTARLRDQGFTIASESDPSGYHAGPTIPLKGDLTNLRNQARIVTDVLVSAGKISAADAMKADLANKLLGVLGGEEGLGGLFGGKGDGEKADLGKTVGGILQGVLGDGQNKDDQKEPSKEDDTTKIIGGVLKGIFGN